MLLGYEEFENIVIQGIEAIPAEFLAKLSNVAIVIEDEPTSEQIKKIKLRGDVLLFGLYEGVPQSQRGLNYTAVLPDKITIFKKAIESAAQDKEDLKKIVKNTVWHEIAHHFGADEERVRQAEQKRQRLRPNE